MAMDAFLAEHYGNQKTAAAAPAPTQEDLEKQASVELFMKLAADQKVDLGSMTDDQVQQLYANWVAKTAEFPPPKDGEHEKPEDKEEKEKHEKAKEEHEEKKAAAEKYAEAEFLGKVMAHSMVAEMRKIAEAAGAPEAAAAAVDAAATAEQQQKEAQEKEAKGMPEALKKGLEAAKGFGKKVVGESGHGARPPTGLKGLHEKATNAAHSAHGFAKSHPGATHGAAGAAGVAAGAGAAHAAHKHHGKEASAIDALAAEHAVKLAFEANFDPEECGRKVAAMLELGLQPETEKVASAPDLPAAVHVRALEFLETLGYPVNWEG
jgi:hypothetical protein